MLKSLFSNKFMIVFFSVTVLVLCISVILRLFTPYSPQSIQEFMNDQSPLFSANFSSFSFSPTQITVPKQLPFYNATIEDAFFNYLNQLQETYNLRQHPNVSSLFIGPDYAVTALLNDNSLVIGLANSPEAYNPDIIDLDTAKNNAQSAINQAFPTLKLSPVEIDIQLYGWNSELYVEVPENEAKVAKIPFSFMLNGYPVLLDKKYEYPAVVTTTNDLVTKIEVTPVITNTTADFQRNTLSEQEAQNQIESGEYVVISYGDFTNGDVDLSTLESVNLTLTSIEYRFVPDSQQLIPFYVFLGNASGENNTSTPLKVITPAI